MGPQMNTILLLLTFTGLVGMLLVVFFMLDRVNEIHKHSDIPQRGHIDPAAVFGGLTGKNLWDAMIGVPMPGWDQKRLAAIRPRYDLVLQKHVELLFEEGKLDGREGFASPIRCDQLVPTLRGEIESWIPHEFASGIYRAGYALATTPEQDREPIRQQIDMVGDALYAATGLPPNPLSAILMPLYERPKRPTEDDEANEEQNADQAAEADGTGPESVDGETAMAALPPPEPPDLLATDLPPAQQPVGAGLEPAVVTAQTPMSGAETVAEAAAEPAPEMAATADDTRLDKTEPEKAEAKVGA